MTDSQSAYSGGDSTVGYTSGMTGGTDDYNPDYDYTGGGSTVGTDTQGYTGEVDLSSLFGKKTGGSDTETVGDDETDRTIGLAGENGSVVYKQPPVVGWLVALNGDDKGKSYPLHSGRNFIGRSAEMDVALAPSDKAVSRNRHAILLYEPRQRLFMVQSGESRELFYLNGDVVLNVEKIAAYDRLMIGKTELLFIPLCGDRFAWDAAAEE